MDGDVSKLTDWYKTKGEKKLSGSRELLNPFKQISGGGAGLSVTGISSARAKPELGNYNNQMQPLRGAPGRGAELFKKGQFLPFKREDTMRLSPLPFPPFVDLYLTPSGCSGLQHVQRDNEASLCAPLYDYAFKGSVLVKKVCCTDNNCSKALRYTQTHLFSNINGLSCFSINTKRVNTFLLGWPPEILLSVAPDGFQKSLKLCCPH